MTESPSLLLQRAAERLEELAAKATPGPWRDEAMGSDGSVVLAGGYTISTARRPARCGEFADATWIATMNPLAAAPLVALLRDAARRMEGSPHLSPSGSTYQRSALELAKAVLGIAVEEEEPS